VAQQATREDDFTTIRIRKKDKADLEELALPREALWETVKRMKDSFTVKRMAQRKNK
jgi:hypothetical protein